MNVELRAVSLEEKETYRNLFKKYSNILSQCALFSFQMA